MRIYVSPGGHQFLAPLREFKRWAFLPYGIWTCADGREVLFNRFYEPIWQRKAEFVEKADPCEWVKWVNQIWFYTDGHVEKEKQKRAKKVLTEWGISEGIN